ncbi:MAG: hypothetical protein ACLPND_24210 [Candidatus Korobacteraceae bacterium]
MPPGVKISTDPLSAWTSTVDGTANSFVRDKFQVKRLPAGNPRKSGQITQSLPYLTPCPPPNQPYSDGN